MRVPVTLLLALALVSACAHGQRHAVVVVDAALYDAIADIHQTEQVALCGQPSCDGVPDKPIPGWSRVQSARFNSILLPIASAGRELNTQLADWQPGQPVPEQVATLVNGLAASLANVTETFPAGSTREHLLTTIARVQAITLATLNNVLLVAAAR